ncbi:MAG: AEC family transporter, partial [Kiritimatiellaeota bacterium]|nr:AEC family transporter [Kiritimatiellota bacterium]
MADAWVVLNKIAVMFLVMLAGWLLCRRGLLAAPFQSALGKFVVDGTFPALVFTQMLTTVSRDSLRASLWVPVLGLVIMALAAAIGLLAARGLRNASQRPTFAFVASMPNWVYLPLPIVLGLFGAEGVRTVLLFNLGAQIFLWTGSVAMIRGKLEREDLRQLVTNPGLLATIAGIAVALLVPGANEWGTAVGDHGAGWLAGIAVQALTMVGSLTIPLSLLVTGAQLSGLTWDDPEHRGTVTGVVLLRLFVAPAVTILLLHFAVRAG